MTHAIAEPREAATILLLRDDPFEVLMVRRNARGTFPSALVFPGGVVDPADFDERWSTSTRGELDAHERAVRVAAVRETWEEVSLLLAQDARGTPVSPDAGAAHADEPFIDLIRRLDAILPLDDLHPFAHWITPEAQPRRFDTHFYLAHVSRSALVRGDDSEVVETRWVAPAAYAERAVPVGGGGGSEPNESEPNDSLQNDRVPNDSTVRADNLLFPTLLNLQLLSRSTCAADAIAAAKSRTVVTVQPVPSHRPNGSLWLEIPPAAGYATNAWRVR